MSITNKIISMTAHLQEAYINMENIGCVMPEHKNLKNISNALDNLYDILPKTTKTGANLNLTSTRKGKMQTILNSNSLTQITYTGKNFIYPTVTLVETTQSGVTFTPVYGENNELLYINVNGTAEAQTSYSIIPQTKRLTLPANTYKVSGISGGSSTTYFLQYSARNIAQLELYDREGTMTLNNQDDFWIKITVKSGIAMNNVKIYPMVRLSSITDNTYEPYVGKMPSPNPLYPQNIHIISGNNTIKKEGKNLAWTGWANDFVNRINNTTYAKLETYNNKNCLWFDRRAGSGDYDNKYVFKPLGGFKENTQYTFIIDYLNTGSSSYANLEIYYTDGTTTEILGTQGGDWIHQTVVSTANKTIKYLKPRWRTDATYINLDTFMVFIGTDTTAEYQSYSAIDYPVTLGTLEMCKINLDQDIIGKSTGKNLLNTNLSTLGKEIYADGTIINKSNTYLSDYIDISNYDWTTISFITNVTSFSWSTCYFDENKQVVRGGANGHGLSTVTTTGIIKEKPVNAKYIRFPYPKDALVMIEGGSHKTEYEPYGTNWYLKKNITKRILNGTENWIYNDTYKYFQLENMNIINNANTISNYFLGNGNNSSINPYIIGGNNNGLLWLVDNADYFNGDVATLIEWLSNHNTNLYYPVVVPQYIDITGTLAIQLDALEKMYSYDEQTNISQTNNDLPFIITASALLKNSN